MALVYKDRVQETTTTTGTGTLTLAGAVSGFQAFSAVGNGNTCIYCIEDANGAWEVGVGTYTSSGTTLARTTILASSNSGSAINLSAGAHNVYVTADAKRLDWAMGSAHTLNPGGRLSVESGVSLSSTDQVGKSTLYYVPHYHDTIHLYDGNFWKPFSIGSQLSLSLSGLTSAKPYDVFIYANSGTPTLELTAWTNDTTRATALTSQNGIAVKTGATDRRYVGSFYSTGTTTTEDSLANRLVWNRYNPESRPIYYATASPDEHTWTPTTLTVRAWNNTSTNAIKVMTGVQSFVFAGASAQMSHTAANTTVWVGFGVNDTTAILGSQRGLAFESTLYRSSPNSEGLILSARFNTLYLTERNGGPTLAATYRNGLLLGTLVC